MRRRIISQIVVSIVLLSVAAVMTATSGSMLMRTLSSYRPTSSMVVRVGSPSLDLSTVSSDELIASVKVLNMGSTPVQIANGFMYILLRGTTGRSKIQICPMMNTPLTIPPGQIVTITVTCSITQSELRDLFTSSWTGDVVKANSFYLFMRVVYGGNVWSPDIIY